jgi:RimJ/RimL family protein N-acetyltransferase
MATFIVRDMTAEDEPSVIALNDAVAAERRWMGSEPPIDHDARRRYRAERQSQPNRFVALVAVEESTGEVIAQLVLDKSGYGVADLGMLVDERWRGMGVGSALVAAAIERARMMGAHKIALQVWPHNTAALALYRRFGFVEEGRLTRHYRRQNGELWDAIVMGLPLD